MPQKSKQIKFRISPEMSRRLEWAMYCEESDSQQECMVAALAQWLNSEEEKWGPPAQPKPRLKPVVAKASGKQA